MRRWGFLGAALAAMLHFVTPAFAQSVVQSGTVVVGQPSRWISNGVIGTGGTSADGLLTTLGLTNNGLASFCISSARQSAAGRNQLCFGARTSGAAVISLQNYGSATAQDLQFNLNGTSLTLPSGGGTFLTGTSAFVVGNLVKINNTSGVLQDAGISLATGTLNGIPYYSATTALTSLGAATNGQMLVGATSAAPNWRTLSGDVSAVSAAGAVTLSGVNGVTYPSSFSANGILYATSTTAVGSTVSSNTGYCLLSQGLSSAPIWAACASGAGSAGGSNTQIQFNQATSLAGSANLTWVSPALVIGVAGTTTGQLQLAPVAGVSGTVTIQNPSATSAYNWNLPTGAGSSGQPLLSGAGGSNPHTYGTLSVSFGGTGSTSASGTTLDTISGFSSAGFINRTGSGTYSFSTTIPVSGGGTALASGTSGGVLCYTASGTLASSSALTQFGLVAGGGTGVCPAAISPGSVGQVLIAQTAANPAWSTMGTDATISSSGALTIAASAVTVAKMANAAAYSVFGNFTASSAAPQYSTLGALTQKASPGGNDLMLLQDQAASGQLKYATVSSVSSAGSVASIAGNTGAFTLSNGITNSTNAIIGDKPVNAQTGTSYAIVDGDRGKLVTTFNAAAQAYTIAQAGGGGGFAAGWYADVSNKSTNPLGVVTITPATSTINGAATLVVQKGQSVRIVSDGTNYQTVALTGARVVKVKTFTATDTYTPSTGMLSATIECVGPGGGATGGTSGATNTANGGSGGSGAYSRAYVTAVQVGASQTVTVGTGGAGGTGSGAASNGSGATSAGALCTAGAGGGSATAGNGSTNTAGLSGAAGTAGTGDVAITGNPGQGGFFSSATTNGAAGAHGGASFFGGAGLGASVSGTGSAATGCGSGGGAGSSYAGGSSNGGAGANGCVIVTEYTTQ